MTSTTTKSSGSNSKGGCGATVPAAELLAGALDKLDWFLKYGSTAAASSTSDVPPPPAAKRHRVDTAATSSSSAASTASALPPPSSMDALLTAQEGFEALVHVIQTHRTLLTPSAMVISRRLATCLPSLVNGHVVSPLLTASAGTSNAATHQRRLKHAVVSFWRSVATFSAVLGVGSGPLITQCLELALMDPACSVARYLHHGIADLSPSASAASGGDAANEMESPMNIVAEVIVAAGTYVHAALLQRFTLKFVSEAFALLNGTQQSSSGAADDAAEVPSTVAAGQQKSAPLIRRRREVTERFTNLTRVVPPVAAMTHALLLVCRPTPTPLLALASALVGTMHAGAPVTSLLVLHHIRSTLSLITMPTPLPWYLPPADIVVTSSSLSSSPSTGVGLHNGGGHAHFVSHDQHPQQQVQHAVEAPTTAPITKAASPKMQPSALMHPAMASSPRVNPTPAPHVHHATSSRKKSRSQPGASPRMLPTSTQQQTSAGTVSSSSKRLDTRKHNSATEDEDAIPDIVLD